MGAYCAGVVVIHIAAMRAAVVPVVEALDWCGGLAAWVLVAIVAGVVVRQARIRELAQQILAKRKI